MRPLTPRAITPTFLQDRPFLLLNVSAFNSRYVGSLLAKNAIKSKGGIALPHEVWLMIFKLLKKRPKYELARVVAANHRKAGTTLACELDHAALKFPVASLQSEDEVITTEKYLAALDEAHDLSSIEDDEVVSLIQETPAKKFLVTISNNDSPGRLELLPHCLFYKITVPDIIGLLQDDICSVCADNMGHTICPGCTGGVAEKFDARMGCGVDLACPSCLGLNFMQADTEILEEFYMMDMPEEVYSARRRRFQRKLKELGYGTDYWTSTQDE